MADSIYMSIDMESMGFGKASLVVALPLFEICNYELFEINPDVGCGWRRASRKQLFTSSADWLVHQRHHCLTGTQVLALT